MSVHFFSVLNKAFSYFDTQWGSKHRTSPEVIVKYSDESGIWISTGHSALDLEALIENA